MPTSKYKISEQVMILLKGGDQKQASSIEMPDIMEAIGQVINKLLKATHFSETMAAGERIPSGLMLATYTGVPVVQYAGRSKAILPAFPQQLPKGLGIFQVTPEKAGVPDLTCEYIPVPPGQFWMIQKEGLISDLLGHIGYENYGAEVVFTKDLTTLLSPVATVMIRMAIADISRLTDFDMLPVPADMELQVVQDVYNLLTAQKPSANIVDPIGENGGTK